ncbi:MAG: hypothetical protein GY804_03755 [Alphaproteobacteria bacterium]|nr:hypothetical protein [Alphaproteobacteria bacterium]
MERHKIDLANEYCNGIMRNYPFWPSTFGQCRNACGNSGRGSGLCADCYEKKLTKLVGNPLAHHFHLSVQNTARLWRDIYNKLDN